VGGASCLVAAIDRSYMASSRARLRTIEVMRRLAIAALGLALASCTATTPSAHPTVTPTTSSSQSVALQPPPKSPQTVTSEPDLVLDLTWISTDAGWALLSAPCARGRCLEIKRTVDGGETWSDLPAPPGTVANDSVDCEKAPCIGEIRFASSKIGFLFGTAFYVTRDGGQTWTAERSQLVEGLEPAGGNAVRLVFDHGGCPGPCNRSVQQSVIGSTSWHTLLSITPDEIAGDSRASSAQLIRSGSKVIFVAIYGDQAAGAGSQHAEIFRTLDGGSAWKRLDDPCGTRNGHVFDAVDVAPASGGFVSAICVPRQNGAGPGDFLLTSDDNGSTWSAEKPIPAWAGLMAAATSTRLVVASDGVTGQGTFLYRLALSEDAGLHWSTVVRDREPVYSIPGAFLGFESPMVGRWVAAPSAIWTTTDGGLRWVRRRIS
jgi:photosystem II stability/assembly factor-like uncharacterized protein